METWVDVDPQPTSPLVGNMTAPAKFYRVKSLDRVPIIAFTGQSNTLHTPRNSAPYSTTDLPYYFSFAQGNADTSAGASELFTSVTNAITSGKPIGSCWEFANALHASDYRAGALRRFAFVQTGLGGRASWEWKSGQKRNVEFQNALDALITQIETHPYTTGELKAVVVNQGERDTDTSGTWDVSWTSFITSIRNKYGNQVQLYIQTLNNLHLMPRQTTPDAGWDAVYQKQLSLATDSGSTAALADTYVYDSNALGGPENTAMYCRDNNVHYSNAGMMMLGEGTFEIFKDVNNF
ncbi:sialate O-acetylesterase [Oceaniferula flava]|uniref:Sialate O-acetylesterase domain-containing protein n=1 Tax=Oceaniferula flava TaxID=2800421 RepID=A0AAE2SFP3_9BACT|nr:sialate O-acetylesterase [Oceaniferula flavus]MBK1856507.1 hypothetical protein [Oceaniferula flavus]